MEENKPIDGAEYITLEDAKRLKNSSLQIVQTATRCMERIFRQGYHYKRAGVIVMGITPDNGIQTNFIDYDSERHEKMKRLDATTRWSDIPEAT